MSRDEVIQVGNKVRRDDWKNMSVVVTAVGASSFLATDAFGVETPWPLRGTWRLEPQVAYVGNAYISGSVIAHDDRQSADAANGSANRIGVLTVMTDGSATYEDTRKSYQEGE